MLLDIFEGVVHPLNVTFVPLILANYTGICEIILAAIQLKHLAKQLLCPL